MFATSSTSQDSPRQSRSFVDCTSVAYPELVSTSVTIVNSSANLVASSGQSPESPSQPRTTLAESLTFGRYQEKSVKQGIFKASN